MARLGIYSPHRGSAPLHQGLACKSTEGGCPVPLVALAAGLVVAGPVVAGLVGAGLLGAGPMVAAVAPWALAVLGVSSRGDTPPFGLPAVSGKKPPKCYLLPLTCHLRPRNLGQQAQDSGGGHACPRLSPHPTAPA